MFRTTKILFLSGALATASLSALALADAPAADRSMFPCEGPRGGKGHGSLSQRLTRHAQELGLTAQQLTAIQAADEATRPELEKLHQEVRAQRDALEAGKGDVEKMKAAHHALHDRREALRTQIEGILTPEQRTKLKSMRGGMAMGMRGRRGPHADHAPAK
jgi:Spy/CpxP family protein refolding chaperone